MEAEEIYIITKLMIGILTWSGKYEKSGSIGADWCG